MSPFITEALRDYDENQLIDSPSRPKFKRSKRTHNNSTINSQSNPNIKVFPGFFATTGETPGPGAYNVSGSLIKPTFNRVYTEPTLQIPKTNNNSQPSYLRPTSTSASKRLDSEDPLLVSVYIIVM